MQVDDREVAIEVPKSHEVVSISSCSTDVPGPRISERARMTEPPESTFPVEGTKFHPRSPVQDKINMSKVLDPAVSFLEAEKIGLVRNPLKVLPCVSRGLWLDAAEPNEPRVFQVQTQNIRFALSFLFFRCHCNFLQNDVQILQCLASQAI